MEIIFVTRSRRNRRRFQFSDNMTRAAILAVFALVVGAYLLGERTATRVPIVALDDYTVGLHKRLREQRAELDLAIEKANLDVDALATQVGQLKARVVRLDALGGRLVQMAELDEQEFAFDRAPALGGLPAVTDQSFSVADFMTELRDLSARIGDRAPKLEAIESTLMNAKLQEETFPSGQPVLKGFISSSFGWRADPVTGKRNFHDGIDFPGKRGSPIVAVASGVVLWAGRRAGYGNVVDVSHGNGLVTRYAHNSDNLVEKGEKVKKGQTIAQMGATGHVTGVHVHFEVLKNGKPINPRHFMTIEKE